MKTAGAPSGLERWRKEEGRGEKTKSVRSGKKLEKDEYKWEWDKREMGKEGGESESVTAHESVNF